MTAGAHTIGRWLTERARRDPDRIAIDDRGVRTSYGSLADRAVALARRLGEQGYGAGDRIATISGNSTDHVVAFFACALSGIALVPLSWRLTPPELGRLVERTAPALVLVDDEHAALAETVRRGTAIAAPWAELGPAGAEQSVPASRTPVPSREPRDDDPLLVIFTSGSEAEPKGVILTHENCFWTNLALGEALPIRADDVVLAALPQFHVAAWNAQPLLAWWVGATVVLERRFDADRALQLIVDRGVTCMMGVPTQYRALAASPSFAEADLGGLRIALVGGETLTTDVTAAWAARGVRLTQGYGLTEAAPNVLCLPGEQAAGRAGAAGRPYPHVEVAVVDVATLLPVDGPATGELWVKGPSVFPGYLDDPEATARALHGPWLRTGDLVRRDADGVISVIDRLKNIYISGGENVSPAEIEAVLRAHPLVRDAVVVGAPDPVWGERGVAFIVPTEGRAPSVDELRAHCRDRIAGFKVPARFAIVAELPRSAIDKVSRHALRGAAERLLHENEGAR